MKTLKFLFLTLLFSSCLQAQLSYPFPQMVPDEFMEPGFHPSVDRETFPKDMRDARETYIGMIDDNQANANALFELRTYTGSVEYQNEYPDATQTLDYEIMVPPADAVAPPDGFPLVFTTYGRARLADVMALDAFRQQYPAYVVSFIHGERPGPLHAPPVYRDFSFLFLEVFDHLFATYNIDTNRVYGSGWSRGGSSMTILSHAYASLGNTEPLITAAVPSAGGFQGLEENLIESIRDVKWLSLQGSNDGNSNPKGSKQAFDQLQKAGALDNIFWWVEGAGHSPHGFGWNVAEVVDWMFAQTKADLALRPDAVLTMDETDADVPLTFTADASASTPNNGGSIVGYSWQLFKSQESIADYSNRDLHGWTLDTGFQGAPVIGTGSSVTETINEPGTWWLRVIVEDDEGNRRAATQEIQVRSVDPTAAFTFSRNHEEAGTAIQFDASDSVAEYGADLGTYAWDFGDGATGGGEQTSHTYATAGTYSTQLTVTSTDGETHSVSHDVTVTSQFPGYRYFRFTGTDMIETYKNPLIREFAFRVGSVTVPRQPMTSNSSQGITVEASWVSGDNEPYMAFDHDTETYWGAHNYFAPGILDIDVGEDQRFVPTGVDVVMADSRNRWRTFELEGSVDDQQWDTLWSYDLDADGQLDDEGSTILFDDVPFVEVSNVDDGGVYGLGTEFALQATTFNLDTVTQVNYFVNGTLLGSSSAGAPFELIWQPSTMGEYELTVEAIFGSGDSTVSPFPVVITINEAPELDHIDITPIDVALYPGDTKAYQAESFSQFGNLLEPQPAITWSVPADAGTIDSNGTFTAGTEFGTYAVQAEATYEGVTLAETVSVVVANSVDFCVEHFAGTELRDAWEFIRKEDWTESRADVNEGLLTIQSRGESMWQGTQKFSAVRRDDITGDFDVSVKVVSQNQNYTADASKLGILVANDFDDLSQGGYLSLHTRGNGRVLFQREGTLGEISSSTSADFPAGKSWPVWLRLVKAGTDFTAYYKFAAGDDWVALGTSTVAAATTDSEVALFASSNNTSETLFGVLTDFIIADCDPALAPPPTIDTPPDGASLEAGGSHTFSVVASGDAPLSYQWLKDGTPIDGATGTSLTLDPAGVSDSGSYTVAVTNPNGTTVSDPAVLEVSGIALTLVSAPTVDELTYGESLSEAVISGGQVENPSADTVAGTFAFVAGGTEPDAGTANHSLRFTPTDDFQYEPLEFAASVTVNPASVSFTLTDLSQSYNATGRTPTVATDPAGVAVDLSFDGLAQDPVDAGSYPFSVEVNDPNFVGIDSGTLVITPAALEVTADDQVKGLGDADPALTWSFTAGQLFGGDTLSGALSRVSGETTGSYAIQQGTLAAGGNYTLSVVSGTLTIVEVLEYTLSYDANNGTGSVPDPVTAEDGTSVPVAFTPEPTRDGFDFLGWKTDPNGLLADFAVGETESLVLTEDTILYAHWVSPWELQENFDALTLGGISGQNGWSGDPTGTVLEDPDNPENQALRFAPNNNDAVSKDLSNTITSSDTATIFYRFYVPEGTSRINQQIRMPSSTPIRLKWDNDPSDPVLWLFDASMASSTKQQVEQNIVRDTWYNTWLAIESGTGEYRIYIEGGDFTEPTLVTVPDMGDDPESHPFNPGTIGALVFTGWNNAPMLYDDFYLLMGEVSLDDPRPPAVQDGFTTWQQENALEEGDTEDTVVPELDGTLTYGDLYVMGASLSGGEWTGLLHAQIHPVEAGDPALTFQGVSGRSYQLQWTADLGNPDWQPAGSALSGNDQELQMNPQVPAPGEGRFYRIQVRLE